MSGREFIDTNGLVYAKSYPQGHFFPLLFPILGGLDGGFVGDNLPVVG